MKSILLLSFSFLLFAGTQAQSSNGLVGYYTFTGNANDQSGNAYHGTVNGASLTTDRFGNPNSAYSFNGTSNYILFNNSFDLRPRTVSLWFKATTIDANLRIAYSSDNKNLTNGMTAVSFRKINNVNKVIFNVADKLDTADITINVWHHVAITMSSSGTINMYLDCNLVGTTSVGSYYHSMDVSTNATAGTSRVLTNGFFAGSVDDIRIYNRALNSTELDTLCTEGNKTGINPVTQQNSISIYPNPASGQVTIDFGNSTILPGYNLKITNSLSQNVYSASINDQSLCIDPSNWNGNGIYFVYLMDAENNIIDVRKLVLQAQN